MFEIVFTCYNVFLVVWTDIFVLKLNFLLFFHFLNQKTNFHFFFSKIQEIQEVQAFEDTSDSETHELNTDNYRVWKRNSLVLYDLCLTHVLEYPALSISFNNSAIYSQQQQSVKTEFAITTDTPQQDKREQNYVRVYQIQLPSINIEQQNDTVSVRDDQIIVGGYNSLEQNQKYGQIHFLYEYPIPLEGNVCKFANQDVNTLISVTDQEFCITNTQTLLLKQANKAGKVYPDNDGGYAVDTQNDEIVHGGNTGIQIYKYNKDTEEFDLSFQQQLSSIVNGVCYSQNYEHVLFIVTDDGEVIIYDTQNYKFLKRFLVGNFNEGQVATSIKTCKQWPQLIFIGTNTGMLMVIDYINDKLIAQKQVHKDSIYQLDVSKFYKGLILTGSEDRKCKLHTIKMNNEQQYYIETIFVHEGQTGHITSCQFHPRIKNLIASVADDNSLMFWWPAEGAFRDVQIKQE